MKPFLYIVFFAFFLSACSGIQTRRGTAPTGDSPFDSQTDQQQDPQQPSDEMVESNEAQGKRPKVALVLGPGAFKTFAYPSFLKALSQSGVQVDEIVGIEWGALSAAFYANNAKPHEAEWKVFKLKKEDVEDSSLFGKGEALKVTNFRKYLQTNFGNKSLTGTSIPFVCPVLKVDRGTVDWGRRGALWRRVEACLASAPRYEPIDDSVPSLFVIDQVANNLKRKGYGIVIFVNVLGGRGDAFNKEDWVTRAYWSEARRHIWQAKSNYTDIIDIDTSKFQPFDFKAKDGLKGVGERAGRKAAKELVQKYNL